MNLGLQRSQDGLYRETFPNGKPSAEYTIKNRRLHGLYRQWHSNGALAEECRHKNGLLHGTVRQWNPEGILLGASKLRDGTGLLRKWYDNGQVEAEWSYFKGELNGRMRLWAEGGMLYTQIYYFGGRQISKKGYLKKCAENPELPRFAEEHVTDTLGNYMRRLRRKKRERARLGPTPDQIKAQRIFDDECRIETRETRAKELVSWLSKGTKGPRELGELSTGKSLRLARRLYALGAAKVWATNIERDPDGAEYSRRLIIKLPRDAHARGKIYEACADPARPRLGESLPAIVTGKRFMSVSVM